MNPAFAPSNLAGNVSRTLAALVWIGMGACGGGHSVGRGSGGVGTDTATGGQIGGGGSGGDVSGPGGATGAGGFGGVVGPIAATVTVDTATRFQIMEGFGGALAFYTNFLADHPNRAEIYNLIFRDLGLDILRIGNWYQSSIVDAATVNVVAAATASLGHAPRLLMSSWSPPATLKSNADTKNGGTLIQQNGAYAYDAFGQWWLSALQAYAARGVLPDFISIQNEPDFRATWETCLFGPIEGVADMASGGINVAGYDRAFEAVYSRVQSLTPVPRMLGPEVVGIGGTRVTNYLSRLDTSHLGGVAHHLYNGGTSANPDSFTTPMRTVATAAGNLPRFMTEYASTPQDMFATAWLINNAVTIEGVTAYIYWDLTWAPSAGLVTTENPYMRASWTTPRGYTVRDPYYAVKHFARWIDTGWIRVAATASSTAVKASAFTSPDGRQTTVVLLNTGTTSLNVGVDTGTWSFTTSNIFRTAGTDRASEIGPLTTTGALLMPPRSIATITLTQ
jgi:glucuronoarabinoxylan endo-1,4-beta-xylanase